jgi:hypothetical protein
MLISTIFYLTIRLHILFYTFILYILVLTFLLYAFHVTHLYMWYTFLMCHYIHYCEKGKIVHFPKLTELLSSGFCMACDGSLSRNLVACVRKCWLWLCDNKWKYRFVSFTGTRFPKCSKPTENTKDPPPPPRPFLGHMIHHRQQIRTEYLTDVDLELLCTPDIQ